MVRSVSFQTFMLIALSLIFAKVNLTQQLDSTFGNNGLVLTNPENKCERPFSSCSNSSVKVFYLPNGKILSAVQSFNETYYPSESPTSSFIFRFIRYSNDGAIENKTSGMSNFVAKDAVQQADGKIVVAGYRFTIPNISSSSYKDWMIARFNLDGTIDNSFNENGFIIRDFTGNDGIERDDVIENVFLQQDGKIVVSGKSSHYRGDGLTVTVMARFNSDGSIDRTFGSYGNGFFDIYDNGDQSQKLFIKSNGKIIVAGSTSRYGPFGSIYDVVISQYNDNGMPDTSFGKNGYILLGFGANDYLADFTVDKDGRILILTNSYFFFYDVPDPLVRGSVINLSRLTADGSFDDSFGISGNTVINNSPLNVYNVNLVSDEWAERIIVDNDDSILISGYTPILASDNNPQHVGRIGNNILSVIRFSSDGRIKARNLSRRTPLNQMISALPGSRLLIQPDGKILVYGGGYARMIRFLSLSAVNDANNFFDYNYDGKADFAVYRPSISGFGTWYFLLSYPSNGTNYKFVAKEFGVAGDIPVPGDYDGDSVQDLALFRPKTGEWLTKKIVIENCEPMDCAETIRFGTTGDIPAPGDFDGDGKTDRAFFRPLEGNWYILFSAGGYTAVHFGMNGDQPVTGDYDGDGKSDLAVIRRQNGQIFWYILQSSDNRFLALQFGLSEDKAVAADYNGDARTEIAVWRPTNGTWYLLTNYTNFSYFKFGTNGDIPEPADFDGDGKADFAVFTPLTGSHLVNRSSDAQLLTSRHGIATDIPVASAYVR